jgi:colanic acid biosynthesis protein WcaH
MSTPRPLPPDDFAAVVRRTPLLSIDLIVKDTASRVLLGLRRNNPAKGMYFVPGGVVFKNERIDAAFRRIAGNELGLTRDRSEARFVGVAEHFYDTNFREEPGYGTHYVVLVHELALPDTEVVKPDAQHAEMQWMTVDEMLVSDQVHANAKAYFR